MKNNRYDDYDLEAFYADVYENYFDGGIGIRFKDETYDNFTGSTKRTTGQAKQNGIIKTEKR